MTSEPPVGQDWKLIEGTIYYMNELGRLLTAEELPENAVVTGVIKTDERK